MRFLIGLFLLALTQVDGDCQCCTPKNEVVVSKDRCNARLGLTPTMKGQCRTRNQINTLMIEDQIIILQEELAAAEQAGNLLLASTIRAEEDALELLLFAVAPCSITLSGPVSAINSSSQPQTSLNVVSNTCPELLVYDTSTATLTIPDVTVSVSGDAIFINGGLCPQGGFGDISILQTDGPDSGEVFTVLGIFTVRGQTINFGPADITSIGLINHLQIDGRICSSGFIANISRLTFTLL